MCMSSQALACKFKPRSPEQLLKAADVVFLGKVEQAVDGRGGDVANGWAVFEVVETSKGQLRRGDRIRVVTHNSSCGISFTSGQVWTIYAAGNPLRADAPSGSFLVEGTAR